MIDLTRKFEASFNEQITNINPKVCFDESVTKEKQYLLHHKNRFFKTIKTLSCFLQPNSKVLDFGVSPVTFILKELFPKIELTTVDLSEKFKEKCFQKKISFVKKDLIQTDLPFKTNSFDVIYFGEILEHLSNDHQKLLTELIRLLKKDGILYLQTPNFLSLNNRLKILLGYEIRPEFKYVLGLSSEPKYHLYEYSLPQVKKLLSSLKNVDILKLNYANYYDKVSSALVYQKHQKILQIPIFFYCQLTKIFPSCQRGIEVILKKK